MADTSMVSGLLFASLSGVLWYQELDGDVKIWPGNRPAERSAVEAEREPGA
ncbi:hypothetical protein [Klebsiella pneumoniae]|uniref:hypothetical protein n=1 Tax=Klebsiella pneumoniae TaxID=573 RepID=UPI0022B64DAC|nr:hypothetical protein [Klebsiella pneumoniae]